MNIINNDIYDNLDLLPMDINGWGGNHKVFRDIIQNNLPDTIIEIGSWKGQSAIFMAEILNDCNLPNSKIYCIDTWTGSLEFWTTMRETPERNLRLKNGYPSVYYQFLSNVVHTNNQHKIIPVPMPSSMAYKYLKYLKITADLIYVDGSHESEDVYNDVKNFWTILNEDGIVFGHNWDNFWPGVKKGVDKFVKEKNIEIKIIDNNFWLLCKKHQNVFFSGSAQKFMLDNQHSR